MPPISRYMTAKPVTVERSASLAEAHRLMRQHAIRHLPVLDANGDLCGIVSERDLHLIETLTNASPDDAHVEDAMIERPFIVTGDAPIDEVVEIMGQQKYGSVVVMGKRGVEGIFTAVDACIAFAQLLRQAVA